MKKIMIIVLSMVMIFGCNINIIAENAMEENNIAATLLPEEVAEIKEQYDLESKNEKTEYLYETFDALGVNKKYVDMLCDNTIDKLVAAEEYGFSINNIHNNSGNISAYATGSESRNYSEIYLAVLWGLSGDEYTVVSLYSWNSLPIMRLKDIISIDLNGGSIVNGSQCAVMDYSKNGVVYESVYNNKSSEYCGTGSACVFAIDLPNSADEISIVLSYSIKSDSTYHTITSQYFHKWAALPVSFSLSYIIGISVSPASSYTEYSLQCGTM